MPEKHSLLPEPEDARDRGDSGDVQRSPPLAVCSATASTQGPASHPPTEWRCKDMPLPTIVPRTTPSCFTGAGGDGERIAMRGELRGATFAMTAATGGR